LKEHSEQFQPNISIVSHELPKFALKKDIHFLAKELKEHLERMNRSKSSDNREIFITMNKSLLETQIFTNLLLREISRADGGNSEDEIIGDYCGSIASANEGEC
jgi:FKBP-type peptidyl-prolyl cis-trans isomerase (trigger factor)